jgi:superfamily II DNA or RNA helicase
MDVIYVKKINEVYLRVDADPGILMELRDRFTFDVPQAKFMANYKTGRWDGKIRLFDYRDRTLYVGLFEKLVEFAEAEGRKYNIILQKSDFGYPGEESTVSEEELRKFVESLNISIGGKIIFPRDYQFDAFCRVAEERRKTIICPTASGKSLIMYMVMRYILEVEPEGKFLIVVPTTSLVEQMFGDFKEYSEKSDWNVEDHVHMVYSGQPKESSKRVMITTWQSLIKFPKEFFSNVIAVNVDEAHTAKAKSLTSILELCKLAPWRIGTTGTLDGTAINELVIEGLLGPVEAMITTAELIKNGMISDISIDMVLLSYTETERKEAEFSYDDEISFIECHEKRNQFIVNVSTTMPGNTLVLFKHVDHGKALYQAIKDKIGERECYLVYGGVSTEERESIRKRVDKLEDCVIVASYGTFSTGINMPEIHNLVFASPYKSQIKVLQSIGRALRKSRDGRPARLVDIADDLSWKKRRNFTLRHSAMRLKIYNRERLKNRVVTIQVPA